MNASTPVCVHVVDDDADVRDGLAWLLASRALPARVWAGAEAFLAEAERCRAHWGVAAVLLDVRMQPVSGLVAFERLRELGCPWPVLFLTGHGDVGMAVAAVKAGAWDFLEKPFHDNELVDRVARALDAAQAHNAAATQMARLRLALAGLSAREHQVLAELVQGHYNKTIAEHLGITMRTVEFHRANIFEKLGVGSAIELAHQLGRLGVAPGAAPAPSSPASSGPQA